MSHRAVGRLSDRHPFEVYLLVFAFISSFPTAVGLTPFPASIVAQLHETYAFLWAITLALGSGVALLGLAWRRPAGVLYSYSVTGLVMEQIGLVTVGGATAFYTAVALSFNGFSAAVPAGTLLAFGLASFAQAWKIQQLLGTLAPRGGDR